jgi:hypothetical protein
MKTKTGRNIICKGCGKEVYMPKYRIDRGVKYCSQACYKTGKTIKCKACGKEFYAPMSRVKQGVKYCSQKCWTKIEGGRQAQKNKENRRGKLLKCPECGKEFYRYPSTLYSLRCSKKCANKYIARLYKGRKYSIPWRQHLSEAMKGRPSWCKGKIGILKGRKGSSSNLWKGGITSPQILARHSSEFKLWRREVLKRDGHKCKICGSDKDLHAHHIKDFTEYPELRYEVENGLTVCVNCHGKIHGRKLPNIGKLRKKQ